MLKKKSLPWIAAALAVFLLAGQTLSAMAQPAAAATDRLPDLAMDRLQNISIQSLSRGRRLLRFTVRVVNIGQGPFEVHGARPDTATAEMEDLFQRIYDTDGGHRDVPAAATMFYSGDGHTHWHVRDLESYQLLRATDRGLVGIGVKRGYCFFDNYAFRLTLPGAPQIPVYSYATVPPACSNQQPAALSAAMGLSIGWGDTYPFTVPGQHIEISGLPNGRYILVTTADPANWFVETNDSNNVAWASLKITNSVVTVLAYGPAP